MDKILTKFDEAWTKLWEKLGSWLEALVTNLPNFIVALLVFAAGLYAARYVKRMVYRALRRTTSNETVSRVIANVAMAVFLAFVILIDIGILNLDTVLASLLAGAGVVGLAVGLALQEPLINLFSGLLLSVRKLYNLGDLVKTNGYFGRIENIMLRTTLIKTLDGQEVTIPNKLVIQHPLTNYTNAPERRVSVRCGVSYGDDLERVRELATQAVRQHCRFDENRPLEFFFTEFGNSSINFVLRFWLKDGRQVHFLQARSEAIIALKQAFDENDVTIPFPIRTLDFGIKGGERLGEVLQADSQTENGASGKN